MKSVAIIILILVPLIQSCDKWPFTSSVTAIKKLLSEDIAVREYGWTIDEVKEVSGTIYESPLFL